MEQSASRRLLFLCRKYQSTCRLDPKSPIFLSTQRYYTTMLSPRPAVLDKFPWNYSKHKNKASRRWPISLSYRSLQKKPYILRLQAHLFFNSWHQYYALDVRVDKIDVSSETIYFTAFSALTSFLITNLQQSLISTLLVQGKLSKINI